MSDDADPRRSTLEPETLDFASALAHELRTPVSVILANTETL